MQRPWGRGSPWRRMSQLSLEALRKGGLKCLSMGKIQEGMERWAQGNQVSHGCGEMSPRAPVQWGRRRVRNSWAPGRPSHLPPPSSPLPFPLLPHTLPYPVRALHDQGSGSWDHPVQVPHLTNGETKAQCGVCLIHTAELVRASHLTRAGPPQAQDYPRRRPLSTSCWPSLISVFHRLLGGSTSLTVPWGQLWLVTSRWEDPLSQSQPWD